jgi:hypothetical protein
MTPTYFVRTIFKITLSIFAIATAGRPEGDPAIPKDQTD